MTRLDADVIVIGAGPAGSAAAIAAAREGADVLLLDRASFPRDKPCGDLIGARALKAARALGIDNEIVRQYEQLTGVQLTTDDVSLLLEPRSRLGRSIVGRSDARTIPRQIFDTALVAAALRAGVRLQTTTVRSIDGWHDMSRAVHCVHRDGEMELCAKVVICAGGYASPVAEDVGRKGGREDERPRGIAIRAYLSNVDARPDQITFCLNESLLPGYGWLFPLPNGRANVGVGTLVTGKATGGDHLHALYRRFTNDPDSPVAAALRNATEDAKPRSWPLDLGPRPREVVADGLLVAGEAAALVGPMTGAGIAFALESGARAGTIAAQGIEKGSWTRDDLGAYARWLRRHPLRWLSIEARAHALVSDPIRLDRLIRATRPMPPTGVVGAWTLLNLG